MRFIAKADPLLPNPFWIWVWWIISFVIVHPRSLTDRMPCLLPIWIRLPFAIPSPNLWGRPIGTWIFMKTIYLASGNAHKLHELQTALDLAGLPVTVSGPDAIGGMPDVEETGSTFEANALLKAHGLALKLDLLMLGSLLMIVGLRLMPWMAAPV